MERSTPVELQPAAVRAAGSIFGEGQGSGGGSRIVANDVQASLRGRPFPYLPFVRYRKASDVSKNNAIDLAPASCFIPCSTC